MKQEDIMKLEAAIAADYSNIAGMVVRKDGETVYERYFGGCTAKSRLNVFSVTKSIVSILLGIALDRGCLGSIDQQVLEFFPEYTPKRGEKTIQRITIRDMLTMTAPYKYRSTPYTKYFTSPDWVRFSLDLLGGKGPVGEFRYAPLIGPDILTGILTRMERDGLVLRLKPVNDQRKLYVSLTKEGNALYQRAQAQVEEAYQQIEAEYTPEKMKQLTALLEEFIELGNRHIAARDEE